MDILKSLSAKDSGISSEMSDAPVKKSATDNFAGDEPCAAGNCIITAFDLIDPKYFTGAINVIDWNCGDGASTICLNSYLHKKYPGTTIKAVKLIEQSQDALERATEAVKAACGIDEVRAVNKTPADVIGDNLRFAGGTVLHIFNHLPYCDGLDIKNFISRLSTNTDGINLVAGCNLHNFHTDRRTIALINYLGDAAKEVKLQHDDTGDKNIFAFTLDAKCADTLKHELPPPTLLAAAYMLDCVADNPRAVQQMSRWAGFEAYSLFYAAAEISDDLQPLLATASNLVSRGLPTLASPGLEQSFSVFFGLTHRTHHHRLHYESNMEKAIGRELLQCLTRGTGKNTAINQMAFTPIEVARIHKTAIEAMLTGRLDINAGYWNILVIEHDVPCGAIAVRDLEELFANLSELTTEYKHLKLPQIRLDIISTEQYLSSPLHLGYAPSTSLQRQHLRRKYDLVIETSIGRCDRKNFSLPKVQAKNGCIFSLFSTKGRTMPDGDIYTSRHITYDTTGSHTANIEYFLGLLFRFTKSIANDRIQPLETILSGKPVHIATNDIAHETAILTLATMLQPEQAIIASASWQTALARCRNLQNAGISSIAMHSHMDRNALDAAWTKIENSQCKMICIESSLMLDNDLQQRFSSLGDRHVHCSHFVLCEADAASMWSSGRFNAMHAQSVSAAWHCLGGNAGHVNVIAFSRIMPDDVTADIVATISPGSAPGRNGNNSITPCMADRCQVQFVVERIDTHPDRIDDFDAIQQSKLAFLGEYLRRLPMLLRRLQATDALMRINGNFAERTGCTSTAISTPMPDNYLEPKNEYEHCGIIFTVRNNGREVEQAISSAGGTATSYFTSDYDDSDNPETRLENFADNRYPLLITPSTPCIDKPNVRFAIDLCRPSSIEQLMATASLCGLDGKMSLVSIFIPHYSMSRLNADDTTPGLPQELEAAKGHMIPTYRLETLCKSFGIDSTQLRIDTFNAANDLLRPNCVIDNDIFMSHLCSYCKDNGRCSMSRNANLPSQWVPANLYDEYLAANGISDGSSSPESLAEGYNLAMPATDTFKHDMAKRRRLLDKLLKEIPVETGDKKYNGLSGLLAAISPDEKKFLVLPTSDNSGLDDLITTTDALYQLALLGIIDDFKFDKGRDTVLISLTGKPFGSYCRKLLQLLMRHLPQHRAEDIASEACNNADHDEAENALQALLQFIDRKHDISRHRALTDIEDLCLTAAYGRTGSNIADANEYIKDYLHYYYHSPYLDRQGSDEYPSLAADTQCGKASSLEIIAKYARLLGSFAEDTGKVLQLHGAVRRLMRSAMPNGTLSILDALCMATLGYDQMPMLAGRVAKAYRNGYALLRRNGGTDFLSRWDEIKPLLRFNDTLAVTIDSLEAQELEIELTIHNEWLNNFIKKYGNGK